MADQAELWFYVDDRNGELHFLERVKTAATWTQYLERQAERTPQGRSEAAAGVDGAVSYSARVKFRPICRRSSASTITVWKRPGQNDVRAKRPFGSCRARPRSRCSSITIARSGRSDLRYEVDGPWISARATVDRSPCWLQRGSRASFEYHDPTREINISGTKMASSPRHS